MKNTIDELTELIYEQKEKDFLDKITKAKIDISAFNEEDVSLLHVASKVEDSSMIIKKLIELGIDINIKDLNGNTPVIVASNYGCTQNCKTLIGYKADLSLYNDNLNTPLHIACASNNIVIAKILIENKAEIDADNGDKKTPLIKAISSKTNIDLVEMLLKNGADINYGNNNATPLMYAISFQNFELVKYLIGKGAKIKGYKNKAGEDTLTYAKKVGNAEVLSFLEKHIE